MPCGAKSIVPRGRPSSSARMFSAASRPWASAAGMTRIDAAIARRDVALEEVLQLRDQLDARVSTADDTHGEHAAPGGRVGLVVGVLCRVEDVITQHDAVLEPLVAERMLLHARHAEARHHAAHRHHEPIVALHALGHDDAAAGEVDVGHGVTAEPEPARAADVSQRLDDVARLDHRRGDLGQERREEQIVPVADQEELDVGAIAQPALQHAHGLHAGEAAAEHDDPHQPTSSTPRWPATTSPMTVTVSPALVMTWRARSASPGRTITT